MIFYGFINAGKVFNKENIDNTENQEEKSKQIYSYEFDDEYIYSAFMTQYKIDLNSIK